MNKQEIRQRLVNIHPSFDVLEKQLDSEGLKSLEEITGFIKEIIK